MKITVTTEQDVYSLDVSDDLELKNFKAFCEVESGVPADEMIITYKGKPLLDDSASLESYGISNDEIVVLQRIPSRINPVLSNPGLDFSNISVPGSSSTGPNLPKPEDINAEYLRTLFSNPEQLANLRRNNPSLAEAITSGNNHELIEMVKKQATEKTRLLNQRRRLLNADPFDLEAQRLIAEEIKRENIDANMETAMEYYPESYGTVVMLYINCKVNGYPVKAFVDSGAQNTILSAACAERCNVMRLVDTRWTGVAKGVGVQFIIGRIHSVDISIENVFLSTSFSVLQDQPMDMLLGLDMLKRHQCSIDLGKNVLRIGTTGTETPFLSESELPKSRSSEDSTLTDEERKQIEIAKDRYTKQSTGTPSTSEKATPTSPSDTVSTTEINTSDPFNETTVTEIISLGFPRSDVIAELRNFKGNKQKAMAALFAKSIKF